MKTRIMFLLTGLIAGLVCVAPGVSWLMLLTLTWGVGPAFFVAVVVGIKITGARHHLQGGFLRYLVGLVVCLITYLLALMVFFGVYGFSPGWFGFRPSENVHQFGIDVVLGLLAATAFAAGGIALFTFVLTRQWSNSLLRRLLWAGIATIIVTFILNYRFHSYWSFFGVLLPLGNALFCYLVGIQIGQQPEVERQLAATAREPHRPPA
jgi:hypothetical protein